MPLISQNDVFPGAGSQFGLGDVTQSLFFSPKALTASGWLPAGLALVAEPSLTVQGHALLRLENCICTPHIMHIGASL